MFPVLFFFKCCPNLHIFLMQIYVISLNNISWATFHISTCWSISYLPFPLLYPVSKSLASPVRSTLKYIRSYCIHFPNLGSLFSHLNYFSSILTYVPSSLVFFSIISTYPDSNQNDFIKCKPDLSSPHDKTFQSLEILLRAKSSL